MPQEENAQDIAQGHEDRMADAERMDVANQTAIQEAELANKRENELPDDTGEDSGLKAEFAKKEADYKKELAEIKKERETADKRLRDTQHKLHMFAAERAQAKPDTENKAEKPAKSFDDYKKEIAELFEEDPKSAFQTMITDFATDRELMRRQYQQEMATMRETVLNDVLMQNPENAQLLAEVEVLKETRPDLDNLTTKQKMEYVKLMRQAEGGKNGKNKKPETDDDEGHDRSLLTSTRRTAGRASGLDAWASDPKVQEEAVGVFESKREMIDWLNPAKAMDMARKMRKG